MSHQQRNIAVGPITIGNRRPLTLLAGPCVIENETFSLRCAEQIRKIADHVKIPVLYKSSFDKANRTSLAGFRGPGLEEGLRILEKVRRETGLPILTDVHTEEEARSASSVVDMLQTPAFLCRQTDFIRAVAGTGSPVNLKKGQFLAPDEMIHVAEKAASTGNHDLLLCERGAAFGYHTLVVDMRSLAILEKTGYPVVFDATHSVQQPGGMDGASGGDRRFVAPLARAAVGCGVAAVFLETHPDPDHAPCDGPNMVPLDQLETLMNTLKGLDEIAKQRCPDLSVSVSVSV